MASVEEWSGIEAENVKLDELSLSNSAGLYWNKIMAALKRKCDDVDAAIRSIQGGYDYKGSVSTMEDLPVSGNSVGDVYSVVSLGGENFAWTGVSWHSLGVFSANLVHIDGDETIGGTKTFSEAISGSVTGNAGTATEFETAQDVTLTGDVTGTASSTAGWSVSTALVSSGVTAGTYGPDSDKSPAAQGAFVVPCFTVDAKGRVTAVVERTITLPADSDTTYSAFSGATSLADGAGGLVPKPLAADVDKVLGASGAWRFLTASDIASGTLDLARIPTMDAAHIPSLDASKIATGTIDVARLPAAALERLVVVADQTARFALTTLDVQLGDSVKQADTGVLYFVVDTSSLDSAAGYVEYTAGAAASVPWSGVTGKPSTFAPSSHTHGNVTNEGKLSTASRAVVTDGNKLVTVSSVTATELGYLSGVTSAIQTQLDGKLSSHQSLSSCVKKNDSNAVSVADFVHSTVADLHVMIAGGNASQTGAYLDLYGQSASGVEGWFGLHAKSSSTADKSLQGRPDGTLKWNGQGVQTSSDERLKTSVAAVPGAVLDAWGDVGWRQFQFTDAVQDKGAEKARLHIGLIAQRVKDVFETKKLDACAYGILCYEPEDDLWMVRYTEALALEAAFQRRRAERLEARIAALEERMNGN